MSKLRCSFCSSTRCEERRTEYLYSYKGQYLLVPNTPVQVCVNCGMIYYEAVLKEIERHFFAIQRQEEEADRYLEVPQKAYSG